MKHYLICGAIDWADEFDVHFFEIIDEDDYNLYKALKEKFGDWYSYYYFGTNEGWEDDFNYLGFDPIELSDEEFETLNKLPITGEPVFSAFYEYIWSELEDNDIIGEDVNFSSLSLEDQIKAIEEYANMRDE